MSDIGQNGVHLKNEGGLIGPGVTPFATMIIG